MYRNPEGTPGGGGIPPASPSSGVPPRSSRHRRSRSDGGFGSDQVLSQFSAGGTGLPKSRLGQPRRAAGDGPSFDAIEEEALCMVADEGQFPEGSDPSLLLNGQLIPDGEADGAGVSDQQQQQQQAAAAAAAAGRYAGSAGAIPSPGLHHQRPPKPNAGRHRRIRSEDLLSTFGAQELNALAEEGGRAGGGGGMGMGASGLKSPSTSGSGRADVAGALAGLQLAGGSTASPKRPSPSKKDGGGGEGVAPPYAKLGLHIPSRSGPGFNSPYGGSPFTSPRQSFGPSPRGGGGGLMSPGQGSANVSPRSRQAQQELDRSKLAEIQGMFQFRQSWQSPRVEGRGPFVAAPLRTPNVSDYYRMDGQGRYDEGEEEEVEVEEPQLPSMANVLRKPYRDLTDVYRLADKELGRGNFGVIRVAERLDSGERHACKTISKQKLECWEDVEDVQRELQIMELLKGHPHIVSIIDAFEDEEEVHLVMELCEGGELFDRILERGYYAERQAAKVCRNIVEVLEHLHANSIMHRDLKPENILLVGRRSDTRLKVIDFGMAYVLQPGERCKLRAGTPNYIAPEVIAKNYGVEADVWSVGVILYVLLCGLPPFWGDTTEEVFRSVLTQELDFETEPWPSVSLAAKDLVRRMLCRDYKKRITPSEILNHPWIKTLV